MIQYYRKLKRVDRMNGEMKTRSYNDLEHQCMVALLFQHFAKIESVSYDLPVLTAVLNHDIVEAVSADLGYPVKNFNDRTKEAWATIEREVCSIHPGLNEFTDEELRKTMNNEQHRLFKVCDLLDVWIFICEEIKLGNKFNETLAIKGRCEKLVRGKYKSVDKFMSNYFDYI